MTSPEREPSGNPAAEQDHRRMPPAAGRRGRLLDPEERPKLGLSVGIVLMTIGAALVILIIPIPGPATVKTVIVNAGINAALAVLGGGGGLGLFVANVLTLVAGAGLVAVGGLLVSPSWKALRQRRRERLNERARIVKEKSDKVFQKGRDAGKGVAVQGRNAAKAIGRTGTSGAAKVSGSARRTSEKIKKNEFGEKARKGISSAAGFGMRLGRRTKVETERDDQSELARPPDTPRDDQVEAAEGSLEIGGSASTPEESRG